MEEKEMNDAIMTLHDFGAAYEKKMVLALQNKLHSIFQLQPEPGHTLIRHWQFISSALYKPPKKWHY